MPRNYAQEALAEHEHNTARQQWMKERVENIKNRATVADVLTHHGVQLRRGGDQEEQFSCPFHGDDRKPSARFYPQSGDSPSGAWCFVCRERWDVISLWRKFNNETRFSETLFNIEKAFGITPPESHIPDLIEDKFEPIKEEITNLFNVCESRLRAERDQFSMDAHLKLGAILDQLHYIFDSENLPLLTIKTHLEQVLNKIGEKVRGKCHAD